MAGTITVREVMRRWSVLLQDSDPQFSRHSESEAVDWLNDAQSALFTYLPVSCSRVDSIKLKAGSLQTIESIAAADVKLFDGSSPAAPVIGSMLLDVLNNMGADGVTVGKAIRPLTDGRELLDTIEPSWHAQTDATELLNFIIDLRFPRQFLTYPPVPPGRLWARVAYIAMPLRIPAAGEAGYPAGGYVASGTAATLISVHDEHVPDLVNYMAARALMKNADYATATGMTAADFGQLFNGSVNAKSMTLLKYNPNLKRLPFAPDTIGAAS